MRKQWKQWETLFSWAPKSLQMMTAAMIWKDSWLLGRKAMTNLVQFSSVAQLCPTHCLDSVLKSRDITLPTKVHLVKALVFPVLMYGCCMLDHKEGWVLKNWCFWTVVLEKTLESPLDCKEIKPVNAKENQSWIFTGRTDAEAEAPILWPPDAKSQLIRKDPDAGKDWGQKERGTTEDEIVGWRHQLDGYEFEKAQGNSDGQGSLLCYSPWGCKE